MQQKSAVWVFTILITIATLYSLSFSLVSRTFENKAQQQAIKLGDSLSGTGMSASEVDAAVTAEKRRYLKDSANAVAYPVLGKTYAEVKRQELNLGLDLQGGMSVTLEVSIPDLVKNLADNSKDEDFNAILQAAEAKQNDSQSDFISLFEEALNESGSEIELRKVFQNYETGEKFKDVVTNDDVIEILREEAKDAINNTESIILKRIDRFGVAQPVVQKEAFSGRISVELPGVDDKEEVRKRLKATANLEFWKTYQAGDLERFWGQAIDSYGQNRYPDAYAMVQDTTLSDSIQGLPDGEREALLKKINPLYNLDTRTPRTGPVVGYALAKDADYITEVLSNEEFEDTFPDDVIFRWDANEQVNGILALYALKDESGKGKPRLDGRSITQADNQMDPLDGVVVTMSMDQEGTNTWGEMTTEAAPGNEAIAIVMDRLVYSAPTVRNPIMNGSSQITMGGSGSLEQQSKDAESLSSLLNAGALPAPAKILNETSVGPSLGAENIRAGLISFGIALLVVLLYMLFYYRGAGLVADIALLANLVFLLGVLAALGAALTLPGIAGIVLTVGMAVDANVLIFERIKEEMRAGKGLYQAISDGYNRAYSAIIDANVTTLLTAIILSIFGSGPIKGFATTLIIGIFTSLFSAIFITRLIFFSRLEKKKSISFSSKMTEKWFTNMNFDFVGKRKTFYVISGLLIAGGLASLFTKGLNYGVDFNGGRTYTVEFAEQVAPNDVRTALEDAFDKKKETEAAQSKAEVKTVGDDGKQVKITTDFMINNTAENVDEVVNSTIFGALASIGDYTELQNSKVAPSISDDFRSGARNATIFSLLIIFIYIAVRFRKWQYGLGALLAMTHDVILVLALFSIGSLFLPFSLEIDQAFIAAILTVIGYSINDTVVVFDRIREFLGMYKKQEPKEVINKALNSTLSRTINTSLSTFVVLLTIFIFAGDNLKGFVFALMVGVVVGTYSSIFIATPSVIDLTKAKELQE